MECNRRMASERQARCSCGFGNRGKPGTASEALFAFDDVKVERGGCSYKPSSGLFSDHQSLCGSFYILGISELRRKNYDAQNPI